MHTLGWTDGYSFVPVGFIVLSSANKANRFQETADNIDHRTNGYKAWKDSLLSKPEAAIKLIKGALDTGIVADYVLMDTWFTTEPLIASVLELGIPVKIVFVRNRNKKSECLYILSTNTLLSDSEIVQIYGNR